MRERLQSPALRVSRISDIGALETLMSDTEAWWRGGFEAETESQGRAERVARWLWSLAEEPEAEAEKGAKYTKYTKY